MRSPTMTRDRPYTYWLTLTLATAALMIVCGEARAADKCEQTDSGITCPSERWQLLRDKARSYEILCEALQPSMELDAQLRDVCADAGSVSRVWARAETADEAQEMARAAQRQANLREGRLTECQAQQSACSKRAERLSETVGEQEAKLERQVPKWVVYGASVGAVLIGGGAGYLVGNITP